MSYIIFVTRQLLTLGSLSSAVLVYDLDTVSFAADPPKNRFPIVDTKPVSKNPLVNAVLEFKTGRDRYGSSDFICTLAALWAEQNREVDRSFFYNTGYAVTFNLEKRTYVVVILEQHAVTIPGSERQTLVLLDDTGKILDEISCDINSRYGALLTGNPKREENDGAHLVIRFIPNSERSKWHNLHTIIYGGNPHTFRSLEYDDPVDWVNKGLVRLAIKEKKFRILFPNLKDSEEKKRKE